MDTGAVGRVGPLGLHRRRQPQWNGRSRCSATCTTTSATGSSSAQSWKLRQCTTSSPWPSSLRPSVPDRTTSEQEAAASGVILSRGVVLSSSWAGALRCLHTPVFVRGKSPRASPYAAPARWDGRRAGTRTASPAATRARPSQRHVTLPGHTANYSSPQSQLAGCTWQLAHHEPERRSSSDRNHFRVRGQR